MNNPPPYYEAIQMDSISPAPLLTSGTTSNIPSLDQSLYPLPESLKIQLSTEDCTTFYIRDTRSCVLIRGTLDPYTCIRLQNANGQEFLQIKLNRIPLNDDLLAARMEYKQMFVVSHAGIRLGVVESNESSLETISVTNMYDKHHYKTNIMGDNDKDIVISKSINTPPLCTAHIPSCPSGTGGLSFSATLVFHSESFLTKVEQCLCISTAIAFMITRNSINSVTHSKNQVKVCVWTVVFLGVIGLIGWGFITWLQAMECKAKPYRCKNN